MDATCGFYSTAPRMLYNQWAHPHPYIDYRCDDGRFWVSASWLSSLNPALLASSETRVNFGIKSKKKKRLSESALCQQVIGDIYFTETWRPEALCRGLGILASPNPGLKWVTLNACPGRMVRFLGVENPGFLKEGVKTYLMAPMLPLNTPTFFHRRIYSLCIREESNVSQSESTYCICCNSHARTSHYHESLLLWTSCKRWTVSCKIHSLFVWNM